MFVSTSLFRFSPKLSNSFVLFKSIRCSNLIKKNSHQDATVLTDKLDILYPDQLKKIPAYRVIDEDGKFYESANEPKLDTELLVSMYKCMTKLNVMDKILYESQRQGRISFYMTGIGEEAYIGSAAALLKEDFIFSQYRESGVLLWRGMSLEEIMNQCYGNNKDNAKGRQVPCNFGSKELNFATISAPLATQMPQAVGSAYAFKREKSNRCCIVYFGDGAASEGDAHAAFNFAATLEVPIIFFCRNNGYAISTPITEQYRGDGIAGRVIGFGMPVVRVDGNDILAVYSAVKAARELAISKNCPVLVESMTYRVGHHSTSDDSSVYRSTEEVEKWQRASPISRFRKYLESKNLWDETQEKQWVDETKNKIMDAFSVAEKLPKPDWRELFTDTYSSIPNNLVKQREHFAKHLEKYKEHYPLQIFSKV